MRISFKILAQKTRPYITVVTFYYFSLIPWYLARFYEPNELNQRNATFHQTQQVEITLLRQTVIKVLQQCCFKPLCLIKRLQIYYRNAVFLTNKAFQAQKMGIEQIMTYHPQSHNSLSPLVIFFSKLDIYSIKTTSTFKFIVFKTL